MSVKTQPRKTKKDATDPKGQADATELRRSMKQLQSKMNYICQLNEKLQPSSDKGLDRSVLFRAKNYVDNNRAVTAMFMLFLNIGSRYINLNMTSSQEYYIRRIMVPELLIFAISWMGSRDILIAAAITTAYSLITRVLLNENSNFCVFKKRMQDVKNLIDTNNDNKISDAELNQAIKVLSAAKNTGEKESEGRKAGRGEPILEEAVDTGADAKANLGAEGEGGVEGDVEVDEDGSLHLDSVQMLNFQTSMNGPVLFEPMTTGSSGVSVHATKSSATGADLMRALTHGHVMRDSTQLVTSLPATL